MHAFVANEFAANLIVRTVLFLEKDNAAPGARQAGKISPAVVTTFLPDASSRLSGEKARCEIGPLCPAWCVTWELSAR